MPLRTPVQVDSISQRRPARRYAQPPMNTCIVTGGAGFLGSHLCDHLLAKGRRVICVDNLDTGSLQNIEHIRHPKFTFLSHDLTEPLVLDDEVDFVYHLASPASPIDYARLPLRGLRRPPGPSPARELLGPCQSDRPARRL